MGVSSIWSSLAWRIFSRMARSMGARWRAGSFRGKLLAEGADKLGGGRDSGLVLQQKRKAFAEFDDEAGLDLARELDLDEADVGAG